MIMPVIAMMSIKNSGDKKKKVKHENYDDGGGDDDLDGDEI